jgi:integrase/recombinase XerD
LVRASNKNVQNPKSLNIPRSLIFQMEQIRIQIRNVEARKKSIENWRMPQEVKREILRFVEELELGKVNRGKKISRGRQLKYLDLLKRPLEFFNKPTQTITAKDVEYFERALSTDKIISSLKNHPYSQATKVDMRKALKIYLRWRLGEATAVALAGWLDTHDPVKTPDFLWEHEAEKLFKKCRDAEQRFIVAMLFDSGARAGEFVNIRYEDVQLPQGKNNFVKIALKEEFSKTKGRTISLFWRHSLSAVQDYLQERIAQGISARDPMFSGTYGGMRMFLNRLGKKVLKRPIHPHLFRHSSATYYASKLNRQELCYRYGWRFSSDMPDVYISRAGMENKELDEKFTNTELGQLKDELAKKDQADKIKDERIKELQAAVDVLEKNIHSISKLLSTKPSIEALERTLKSKLQS